MSVEALRVQIVGLMRDLAKNGMLLRMEKRMSRKFDLMAARMEIYKSICHRQGLMIEALRNEVEYSDRKVA